ncbi:tyrosine-protein kinase [Larkinella harenae]
MSSVEQLFTEGDDSDILSYFYKYIRYWYWIALSLIISIACAYIYLKKYTPIYQVSATLLIKDDKKMNTEVLEKLDMGGRSKLVENEIEVLKSRALSKKIVEDLNLEVTYWKEAKARDNELHTTSPIVLNASNISDFAYDNPLYIKSESATKYKLLDHDQVEIGAFHYSQLVSSKYGKFRVFNREKFKTNDAIVKVVFQKKDFLVNDLIHGLQISLLNPKTTLISLGLETSVPIKGIDILSKLLNEYTFLSLEDKNREATNTLRFIEERLKLVTAELGDVEQNVESYRRKKGVNDLSSEANLFLGKVEENDSKLNELEIQLKVLDGIEKYLNSAQVGIVAPATMMGVSDPVLNSYIEQLSKLEIERSKLAQTVQPGNPYLETILSQMRNVKQAINENLINQKASLNVSKKSLIDLNNRLEASISSIPRKEREFVGIKRQANIKEDLYLLLLKTREETALSYASAVTDSRIVDAPYTTGDPIRPNTQNIYLVALLLGIAVPIALIIAKESLTNTVQSKKEIERKTGLEVFAEIGVKDRSDKGEVIDIKSRSFVSEQVRMLRSNLQYLFHETQEDVGKTVLITSSSSGEGKSFVAINLAASLAFLDKKVVILGFDLRKPKVQEYLQVSNMTGLSNYLIGKADIEDVIQTTSTNNVYIIPSGPIPPNPSELIANGRVKYLFDSLRKSFDFVIVDTPPVGLVTDATLLASFTDVCFYLVRHERTPRLYLNTISDLNRKGVFKSLNIIFNGVNYKNSAEYGYGYGYGGYYEEKVTQNGWLSRLVKRG